MILLWSRSKIPVWIDSRYLEVLRNQLERWKTRKCNSDWPVILTSTRELYQFRETAHVLKMPLKVRNNPVFMILWASLVVIKSEKSRKINENHENHWFSTAKFKHFYDFLSPKLFIFVYFLSYLYTCATGMNFCDNHRIINIYNRMFWFFDEIHFFRDFEWILWFSTHFFMKIHWFSLISDSIVTGGNSWNSKKNHGKNEFQWKIKMYGYK